ncbi:tetratricopeptide repeat protein [Undibacterium sp. Di27W]|uniref:tetratricopeptide repeat protein n=1 Tax=Undibacterium sp. Di27W TaxID=3413036 RepID=UPI003BF3B709
MSAEPRIKIYQDDITPFLQRLPTFLLFPFQPAPFIMIAGLSALSIVTVFAFGMFRGLLTLFFLRYAYAVMEMGAMGKLEPKWDDIHVWGNKDARPYKQNLVFLLYFILMVVVAGYAIKADTATPAAAYKSAATSKQAAAATTPLLIAPDHHADPAHKSGSPDEDDDSAEQDDPKTFSAHDVGNSRASDGAQNNEADSDQSYHPRSRMDRFLSPDVHFAKWFYLVAMLFALPLPAAVMVLAIEDNVWRALNPMTMFFFIRGMGASYFVVWFIFGMASLALEGLRHLIPPAWSPFVSVPLLTFLNFYLILACYSMMGYVLYQYHQQLGLPVAVDFDTHRVRDSVKANTRTTPVSSDPFIQRIDALLLNGELDTAIRLLEDEMRYERTSLSLNEKLYQLLQRKGDEKRINEQRRRYMLVLSKAGCHEKALHMLSEQKKFDTTYEIQPDDILQMANSFFVTGDFRSAMKLIQGFDKNNPKHADIPAVYMLAARLSGEHFRKYAQAISILKVILQRYPEAGVVAEASNYLEKMQNILAVSQNAAAHAQAAS